MGYGKLEGRLSVPTGGFAVNVQEFTPNAGPVDVTVLGTGTYYPSSGTPILSTIAAALDANGTLDGDYSLSLDSATGRVTISATGVTTFTLIWTSTELRDVLGFSSTLSGAASYLAPGVCKLVHIPAKPRGPGDAPDGSDGAQLTDASFTMSPDGSSKVLVGATRYKDTLRYPQIHGHRAWTHEETTPNESLQTWWTQVIGRGAPFRYHPDRTDDATYVTYRAVRVSEIGLEPVIPTWTDGPVALWNWETEVVKYV